MNVSGLTGMLGYNKQVRSWLSKSHMLAPSCPFLFSRLGVTTINKCRTTELSCSDFTSGFQTLLCRRVLWPLSVRCVCWGRGWGRGLAEVGDSQRRVWYWGWLASGCAPRTPHPQINQSSAFICFIYWASTALYHGSPVFRRGLLSYISW